MVVDERGEDTMSDEISRRCNGKQQRRRRAQSERRTKSSEARLYLTRRGGWTQSEYRKTQHIYSETNKYQLRRPQKSNPFYYETMARLMSSKALSRREWLTHRARDRWVIGILNHFLRWRLNIFFWLIWVVAAVDETSGSTDSSTSYQVPGILQETGWEIFTDQCRRPWGRLIEYATNNSERKKKRKKKRKDENKRSSKKWAFCFLGSFSLVKIDREGEMKNGLEVNTERRNIFINKHQLWRPQKNNIFYYETMARLMSKSYFKKVWHTAVHATGGVVGISTIFFINIFITFFCSSELLWRPTKQVGVQIVIPRTRYQVYCKKQAGKKSQSEPKA